MTRLLTFILWAVGVMTPAVVFLTLSAPLMEGQPHPLAVMAFGYGGTVLGAGVIFALDRFVEKHGL